MVFFPLQLSSRKEKITSCTKLSTELRTFGTPKKYRSVHDKLPSYTLMCLLFRIGTRGLKISHQVRILLRSTITSNHRSNNIDLTAFAPFKILKTSTIGLGTGISSVAGQQDMIIAESSIQFQVRQRDL